MIMNTVLDLIKTVLKGEGGILNAAQFVCAPDCSELTLRLLELSLIGEKLGMSNEPFLQMEKFLDNVLRNKFSEAYNLLSSDSNIAAYLDGISINDFIDKAKAYLDEFSPKFDYDYIIDELCKFGKKNICLNVYSSKIADFILRNDIVWSPASSFSKQLFLYQLFCLYIQSTGSKDFRLLNDNYLDNMLLLSLDYYSDYFINMSNDFRNSIAYCTQLSFANILCANGIFNHKGSFALIDPSLLTSANSLLMIPSKLMSNDFWGQNIDAENGLILRNFILEPLSNLIIKSGGAYCYVVMKIRNNICSEFEYYVEGLRTLILANIQSLSKTETAYVWNSVQAYVGSGIIMQKHSLKYNLLASISKFPIIERNDYRYVYEKVVNYMRIKFINGKMPSDQYCMKLNRILLCKLNDLNFSALQDYDSLACKVASGSLLPSLYTILPSINSQVIEDIKYYQANGCKGLSNNSELKDIKLEEKDFHEVRKLSEIIGFGYDSNRYAVFAFVSGIGLYFKEDGFACNDLGLYLKEDKIKGSRKKALEYFLVRVNDMLHDEASKRKLLLQPLQFVYLLLNISIPKVLIYNAKAAKMYVNGIASKKIKDYNQDKSENVDKERDIKDFQPLLDLLVKYEFLNKEQINGSKFYTINETKKGEFTNFKAFWRAVLCLLSSCNTAKVLVRNNARDKSTYLTYELPKGTRSLIASFLFMTNGGSIQSREQQFKGKDLRSFIEDLCSYIKKEWRELDLWESSIDQILATIRKDYHSMMFYIVYVFIRDVAFDGASNDFLRELRKMKSYFKFSETDVKWNECTFLLGTKQN